MTASVSAALADRRRQWDQFGNLGKNSAIRTLLRRDRKVRPAVD